MVALQQQIIEIVSQLDEAKQIQVLEYVRELTSHGSFDFGVWMAEVDALQAQTRAKYGEGFTVDVQSLLDEVREDRLDDFLGSC